MNSTSNRSSAKSAPKPGYWRWWGTFALRWSIMLAVALGVGRRVFQEREQLATYNYSVDLGWLLASGVLYLVGLGACAVFWRMALQDGGARPHWISCMAAYYAGHLGKYVPGKGLVIAIRATMLRGPGVTVAAGAVTSVHETLLMMATGALLSALILFWVEVPHRNYLLVVSLTLGLLLATISLSPLIYRVGRLVLKIFPGHNLRAASEPRWQTLARGLAIIAMGWLLMGLSLVAVLLAMHRLEGISDRELWVSWGLLTVSVALATVGGFLSLTPGGLGSREWILVEILGPTIGNTHAVIAAGLLRLVWIFSEAAAAGFFWITDKQWTQRN